MKYSIFYLIKGKAGKYIQKLVQEVGPKFAENYMIKNPLPSHITIKAPFETDNIKDVEKVLREFVREHHTSKINIEGFGNFNRFVSFLNTKFSREALRTQKELLNELTKIRIKPSKFDKKFKPHVTVAYGNTKKSFHNIWNYLKKLDKPKFDLKFDNLTIMKKTRKRWVIYKEFKIRRNK